MEVLILFIVSICLLMSLRGLLLGGRKSCQQGGDNRRGEEVVG